MSICAEHNFKYTYGYGHCGLLSRAGLCVGVFIQLAYIFYFFRHLATRWGVTNKKKKNEVACRSRRICRRRRQRWHGHNCRLFIMASWTGDNSLSKLRNRRAGINTPRPRSRCHWIGNTCPAGPSSSRILKCILTPIHPPYPSPFKCRQSNCRALAD